MDKENARFTRGVESHHAKKVIDQFERVLRLENRSSAERNSSKLANSWGSDREMVKLPKVRGSYARMMLETRLTIYMITTLSRSGNRQ